MTKLLTILIVTATLTLSGCDAFKGVNDDKTDMGNDLLVYEDYYELDGWGSNPDIYLFTPRGSDSIRCMAYVDVKGGVVCWRKWEYLKQLPFIPADEISVKNTNKSNSPKE